MSAAGAGDTVRVVRVARIRLLGEFQARLDGVDRTVAKAAQLLHANARAVQLLDRALELLESLPESTERLRLELLRAARDTVAALPRDAGGIIVALNAPPAPFVPAEHHFVPGVALLVAGFSSAEAHAALVAEPRRRPAPLFELVTEIPYTGLQQMLDEAAPRGIRAYSKSLHLDELSDQAIDIIADRLPGKASPMSLVPIFSLGGAFTDRGDDDTAFGGRRSTRYVVNVEAVAPDQETLAADREWARSLWAALQPFAAGPGGYVNFMAEFETDRIRAAYGEEKYRELARIKERYDPDNVFHHNANIPPERSEADVITTP